VSWPQDIIGKEVERMQIEITFPERGSMREGIPVDARAEFQSCIERELYHCVQYALGAREPSVIFRPIRETPKQLILEFEVLDLQKSRENRYNWHGQNTSQWVYAGAIVYDRNTGRVSTHH